MASLASLTQSVLDIVDESFDFMLQLRVEDSIIGCRAILIRQEYTKTRQFPSYAMYDVVIPISLEDCDCAGLYTTEGDFPDIVQLKEQSPFSFVGTDRFNAISYIMPEEMELYQFNPISSKLPRYTYMSKKPYFRGIGNLDKIRFRAPFADPRQLKKYGCTDEHCFTEDDDNFIEQHLRSIIIKMVLEDIRKATDDHQVQANNV